MSKKIRNFFSFQKIDICLRGIKYMSAGVHKIGVYKMDVYIYFRYNSVVL